MEGARGARDRARALARADSAHPSAQGSWAGAVVSAAGAGQAGASKTARAHELARPAALGARAYVGLAQGARVSASPAECALPPPCVVRPWLRPRRPTTAPPSLAPGSGRADQLGRLHADRGADAGARRRVLLRRQALCALRARRVRPDSDCAAARGECPPPCPKTAPCVSLVPPRAQAAPTHPRAQPEHPGGSPWP